MTPADITGTTLARSTDAAHAAPDNGDKTESDTLAEVLTRTRCTSVYNYPTWGQIFSIDYQTRPVVGNPVTELHTGHQVQQPPDHGDRNKGKQTKI